MKQPVHASCKALPRLLLQALQVAGGILKSLLEGVHGHACRCHTLQLTFKIEDVCRPVREQPLRSIRNLCGRGAVTREPDAISLLRNRQQVTEVSVVVRIMASHCAAS